jgi:hypothetical protein
MIDERWLLSEYARMLTWSPVVTRQFVFNPVAYQQAARDRDRAKVKAKAAECDCWKSAAPLCARCKLRQTT